MRSRLRDEDVLLQRLLNGAQGERGLAVAPRREEQHVLAAAQVGEQRLQLLLAIDEGVVEARFPNVNGFSLYTIVLYTSHQYGYTN